MIFDWFRKLKAPKKLEDSPADNRAQSATDDICPLCIQAELDIEFPGDIDVALRTHPHPHVHPSSPMCRHCQAPLLPWWKNCDGKKQYACSKCNRVYTDIPAGAGKKFLFEMAASDEKRKNKGELK